MKSSPTQRQVDLACMCGIALNCVQKRQIYDRHGEEGLKAHEGGQQHHGNPFDMFQNFFGGGREFLSLVDLPCLCAHAIVDHHQQVRKGPTSLTEFEVSLADIYSGGDIEVRAFGLL